MSGIHLRPRLFFLFFLLKIMPLKASIDGGAEFAASWDNNQWPLPPGQHHVRMWFLYFWFLPIGKGELVVDVPANQVVPLEYKPPWIVFLPGKVQLAAGAPAVAPGAAPAAPVAVGGAPAGWQTDPSGRFEQRYWDGNAWTEHVSTGGVASSDPVG